MSLWDKIRDKILPDGYDRAFRADTLQQAFQRFYWNGRHYDQHLLLDPAGVPWIGDGQRCQPQLAERQAFHQACRSWLQGNGQRFCELSGGWDERRQAALKQVATLLGSADQDAGPGH